MSETVELQSGYVAAGDARLYYEEVGKGDALVLLHAGIADRRMWDEQMDAFARHFRTIRFDTRGYGQSTMGEQPAKRVQDLYALLGALDVEAAIVLGCSQGGTTAIDFALAHPEMTSALIAVAATPSGFEFSGEMPPIMGQLFGALGSGNLDRAADLAAQIWFDGPERTADQVDAEQRAMVVRMMRDVLASGTMDTTGAYFEDQPAQGRLDTITVPTLILVGEEDAPVLMEVGQEMAAAMPDAHLVTIADAAHLPSVEQPARFNEAVLTFLQQR